MPLMPQSSDRKLLFIGAVLVLALMIGLAALTPGDNDDKGFPSSYNVKRDGGKAAFLLLKQSGFNIERWDRPPQELPAHATDTLLIVAQPSAVASKEEVNGLQGFVASGGTVLFSGSVFWYNLPGMKIHGDSYRLQDTKISPAAPTRLSRGGAIVMGGSQAWDSSDLSPLVHYAYEGDPVVVTYDFGKGHVIWWASAKPLTNAGIRQEHNLDLLVNSVSGSKRILWDEYSHHERQRASWGLADTAIQSGSLQLLAFGALLLFTYSRRSGPLVPRAEVSRLSPLEFVETLANVYHRAGAQQAAVEIAFGRFRQMLGRRLGLYGRVSAVEMAHAVEFHGLAPVPNFSQQLQRCESAISDPDLTEKEAVQLVQFLNQAASALQLITAPPPEKPHAGNTATAGPRP